MRRALSHSDKFFLFALAICICALAVVCCLLMQSRNEVSSLVGELEKANAQISLNNDTINMLRTRVELLEGTLEDLQATTVYIGDASRAYHKSASCTVLGLSHSVTPTSRDQCIFRGYSPCLICQP